MTKVIFSVQPNYCRCHPETCCCDPWAIFKGTEKYLTVYDKKKAYETAAALNNNHK